MGVGWWCGCTAAKRGASVEKPIDLFTGASTGASGAAVRMTIVVEVGADAGLGCRAAPRAAAGAQGAGLRDRHLCLELYGPGGAGAVRFLDVPALRSNQEV